MSYQSKKNKTHLTRRQTLALCGAGLGSPLLWNPTKALMRALIDGIIVNAEAQTSQVQPRTLINYHLGGAPLRTFWDLPLSPYANQTLARSAFINTGFSNSQPNYRTLPVALPGGTIHMPYLWASKIATPSGSTNMTDLLQNALMIRGVQGNSDGSHAKGIQEMTRPTANAPSLMGLVADASNRQVQSVLSGNIQTGVDTAFKSAHASQTIVRNMNSPMQEILGPFDRSGDPVSAGFMSRRVALDSLVQRALATLGQYAASSAPGSEALYGMRNTAEQALKNGINSALSAYPIAFNKYRKLISDCVDLKMIGITDQFVSNPGIAEAITASDGGTKISNPNLATVIGASTYPGALAHNFAIAEVLSTQGLSSSIALNNAAITGLAYSSSSDTGGFWDLDEHAGGTHLSMIVNSFLYQALSSCIFELINTLKAKNLFTETVIYVTGDFGRKPGDKPGTAHAHEACNFSIFSGAITAPSVIGNISNGGTETFNGYQCKDYGQARSVSSVFGASRSLSVLDVASTVASLVRTVSPAPNNPPLVNSSGVPLIEKAREVA